MAGTQQDEALSKIRGAFSADRAEAALLAPLPGDSEAIPGFDRPHYGVRLSFQPPLTAVQASEAVWRVLPILPEGAGVDRGDKPVGAIRIGQENEVALLIPKERLGEMAEALKQDERSMRLQGAIRSARMFAPTTLEPGAGLEDYYAKREALLATPRERELSDSVSEENRGMVIHKGRIAAGDRETLQRLGLQPAAKAPEVAPEGLAAIKLDGVKLDIGAQVAAITPQEALEHRNLIPGAASDGAVRRPEIGPAG